MSPQINKISSVKAKRNPKLKKQKTGAAAHNDFLLKYLALNAALKIPIFMCHCMLIIAIISNGNPYERTRTLILGFIEISLKLIYYVVMGLKDLVSFDDSPNLVFIFFQVFWLFKDMS